MTRVAVVLGNEYRGTSIIRKETEEKFKCRQKHRILGSKGRIGSRVDHDVERSCIYGGGGFPNKRKAPWKGRLSSRARRQGDHKGSDRLMGIDA